MSKPIQVVRFVDGGWEVIKNGIASDEWVAKWNPPESEKGFINVSEDLYKAVSTWEGVTWDE